MQSLGFSFSDFKKDIYYDGHDREDNVQHRINLIGRYFDWQDVSKGIPGYSSRANHFVHFNRADAKRLFGLSDADVEQYAVLNSIDLFEFHVDDWDVDRVNLAHSEDTFAASQL